MKYLIFGRKSWIGEKFGQKLRADGATVFTSQVDVTDLNAVRAEIKNHKPDVVINAAGKTGRPNIDWCEDHKIETLAVNTGGAINILVASQEFGVYLVHLGSGCLFSNNLDKNPLTEESPVSPPSFYSWTKYWADEALKRFPVLIVRIRMPIDAEENPRNLITKLSKYQKIVDVENSITVLDDLYLALNILISKKRTGIYNVVNPGKIKHKEMMEMYSQLIDPLHRYEIIPLADLAKRGLIKTGRSNCVLSTAKLENEGIQLPPIQDAIRSIMIEYKKNISQQNS